MLSEIAVEVTATVLKLKQQKVSEISLQFYYKSGLSNRLSNINQFHIPQFHLSSSSEWWLPSVFTSIPPFPEPFSADDIEDISQHASHSSSGLSRLLPTSEATSISLGLFFWSQYHPTQYKCPLLGSSSSYITKYHKLGG